MSPVLLKGIEGKKRQLDRLRPFPPAAVARLRDEFLIEWTYNSNAIEGNTLSLRETELVLRRGLTIGNKTLKEHFEALNHQAGIEFLERFVDRRSELDEDFIRALHGLILRNIDDGQAGAYRSTNVRILGAVHLPPDSTKVPGLINELLCWYSANRYGMPAPELAAWLHYLFVWIHPFIDGNGRTARLLMNLALLQAGYPPAVILTLDRKRYYRVLREADLDRPGPFLDFIGRSIDRSLAIYLHALSPAKDPGSGAPGDTGVGEAEGREAYVSLRQATRYCSYSLEYLSFLARSGRLPAVKFRRNWMTTREEVEDYAARHADKEPER